MKSTTLLFAALIISISAGTAVAGNHHSQKDQVVTKHTKIINHQSDNWQHKSYKAQTQHHKSYKQHIRNNSGKRARIARLIRAKQLKKQQRQQIRPLAAQIQRYNQQRHEQIRNAQQHASRGIVQLPIPRIALFFPW